MLDIRLLNYANDLHNELRENITELKNGKHRNYLTGEESEQINKVIFEKTKIKDFGNKHRSQIEMFYFIKDKPKKYTAYLSKTKSGKTIVSNWMGKFIAYATITSKYKDNFGGERINFRTKKAINGLTYFGTGFCGIGGYCIIKAYKQ